MRWLLVLFSGLFLSLCILFEHRSHEPVRRAERSLAQATKHSWQVYPTSGSGNIQNAEGTDDVQVARAGRCRAVAFVHEEKTGLLFRCESDGIALAGVEVHE